jgi:hypothetical protein
MLFNREWSGVHFQTKNLDVGQNSVPQATKRKRKQLGNNLEGFVSHGRSTLLGKMYASHGDRRISEEEELIQPLESSVSVGKHGETMC